MRNIGLRGKQKLADKWQDDVYVVVDRPNPDIPVYRGPCRPEAEDLVLRTPPRLDLIDPDVGPNLAVSPVAVPLVEPPVDAPAERVAGATQGSPVLRAANEDLQPDFHSPPPRVRRSGRTTRRPQWMDLGAYNFQHHADSMAFDQKLDLVQSMLSLLLNK